MAGSRVGEGAMGGVVEGGQRDGGPGQGSKFEMQTFGLQVAKVMEAIPLELDPTGRAVYLALFWRAYGRGESWCEISQEALAAACGVTRKTVKAAMKALAIARLVTVEQAGTKSHATRYRIHLAREAGIRRYWEVPAAWRAALGGTEAPMLLRPLDEEDRALLEGKYDGLGQGERDRLLQEAVRILRARGWRRPELAGEDLEKMMQEVLLQRSFGPGRLRKYRERLEAQEFKGESGGDSGAHVAAK